MNWRIVSVVFRKEVVDLLRDRRTMISMVALPVLVFPLIFTVMGKFMGDAEKRAEKEANTLAVSEGPLDEQLEAALMRGGFQILRKAKPGEAVSSKQAAAGLGVEQEGKLLVVYSDGTRQASGLAADKVRTVLNELRDGLVMASLIEASVNPAVLKPFTVKRENVATERQMGGFVLGSMLGYIVILLMFSGGMYPAIDMAAGEKERRTLEALVASPAQRTDIVLGKIMACVMATYATALLTTGSLFFSLKSGAGAIKGLDRLAGNVPTDGQTIGLVLLVLLPVAVMAGSLMLAIALLARSFKEAQSYLTPLIMLVIFPSLLGGLPGMELTPVLSLIPIFNASQLLKAVLQGQAPVVELAVTLGANFTYAAICFAVAVKSFSEEKVLFRT